MFKFSKNRSNTSSAPREYKIAGTTAIEKGEVVKFTPGTGVVAIGDADQDDPYLGVSSEDHDGSTSDFIGRQTGTNIFIYDDPNDIFELKQDAVETLTGGSTTTAVISGLLPQTDDLWNEGYIEIVTCAANSDLIGKMVKINDSTGATGTLTLAETLPSALASGDTIKIYPGPYAIGEYGWDLNSDGTDIDYSSSGGESLILVDVDPAVKKSFWKLRLHQLGNDASAK